MAIDKKSTIFIQSLWNLVKISTSCVGNFAWILAKLDENCGFFINVEVLSLCPFICITLYVIQWTSFASRSYYNDFLVACKLCLGMYIQLFQVRKILICTYSNEQLFSLQLYIRFSIYDSNYQFSKYFKGTFK